MVDDICTLKLVNNEVKIAGNEEIIDKARINVLTNLFIAHHGLFNNQFNVSFDESEDVWEEFQNSLARFPILE